MGYIETQLEYHLPGVDHSKLSDEQLAQKWAHLQFIREEEAKAQERLLKRKR